MTHNASHKLHCSAIKKLHLIPVRSWTLTFSSRRLNPAKRPWLHSQTTPVHFKWICSHSLLLPLHLHNGNSRFYRARGHALTARAIQNSVCTCFWRVVSWLIFLHVKVKCSKLYVPCSSLRQRARVHLSPVKLRNWTVRTGCIQSEFNIEEGRQAQTDIHPHTYTQMCLIWLKSSTRLGTNDF